MEFKEVLITEDNTTYSVKKEITAKVVIKTKAGFVDSNQNLCVVEDNGNGYTAHFPSFSSTQPDQYVCLDYAQAEYLMRAIATLTAKEVTSKEVQVKPSQKELNGWIEHDGGEQPVSDEKKIDVKFRDGLYRKDVRASWLDWSHDGDTCDIVAWCYTK